MAGMETDQTITPVIMSGGAGTRLWPASQGDHPKQLLSLIGERTLIQDTALRLRGRATSFAFTDPLIVCNESQLEPIRTQLADIGQTAWFMTEPCPRNTAPCALMAALEIAGREPDALMLLAPADHYIRDEAAFHQAIGRAVPAARSGHIVTFGITPTAPETGYGYIEAAEPLDAHASRVAAFHEKPDFETARRYLASGNMFWNAGIFLCRPDVLIAEMQALREDIFKACQTTFAASPKTKDTRALDAALFAACPAQSIDYAVMEKTTKAAIVEADIGWSDIGSWRALRDLAAATDGNAVRGNVLALESKDNLIYTDGPLVAALGVDNLAIVVHEGQILVAAMDRVQDVKTIVEALKNKS